eukprot:scaffold341546_cov99-Cyclotella_meneghiniana.AAC.3
MRFWELAKLLSVALSSLQAKGPSNRSRNLRHASSTQVGGIPPEELCDDDDEGYKKFLAFLASSPNHEEENKEAAAAVARQVHRSGYYPNPHRS